MYIWNRWYKFGNQSIVSFEAKFRINEEDFESLLEGLDEILFNHFNFHIWAQKLVEFVKLQEGVWTHLEISKGVDLPLVDNVTWDLNFFCRKVLTDSDDEKFYHLNHVVRILLGRQLIRKEVALDFLNGQGVEKHTDELEAHDGHRLVPISGSSWEITEATSGQGSCYKIDGDNVFVDEVILCLLIAEYVAIHPRTFIAIWLANAQHYHDAGKQM